MLAKLLCKRQQKAPISDVRESRVVAQAQRREDVKESIADLLSLGNSNALLIIFERKVVNKYPYAFSCS